MANYLASDIRIQSYGTAVELEDIKIFSSAVILQQKTIIDAYFCIIWKLLD